MNPHDHRSGGPKTPQGKQISSMNALRHGLTGQTVILPSEDRQAYDDFAHRFRRDYKPETAEERQIVQTIVDCSWRLNRLRANEQTMLALTTVQCENVVKSDDDRTAIAVAATLAFQELETELAKLSLYEQRITRTCERHMKLLKEVQATRVAAHNKSLQEAALLKLLHDHRQAKQPQPVPYNPRQDQFVFSNSEIDAYADRDARLYVAQKLHNKVKLALAA